MRGIVFTMDALAALLIVAATVPFIVAFSSIPKENEAYFISTEADNAMDVLSKITVRNVIREPVIYDLYSQGIITDSDIDKTVMDLVLGMWASNSTANVTRAQNITEKLLKSILAPQYNVSLLIEDEALVEENVTIRKSLSSSRMVASGYMKGARSAGYVAGIYLTSIGSRRGHYYRFFGGFVGQGNISFNVSELPADATIKSIYMEMDIGTNFTLIINGQSCGVFAKTSSGISSDNWTIESAGCLDAIEPGQNNTVLFDFSGTDNFKEYIGGGFFKISYDTNQLMSRVNTTRFYIPGIEGAINYYDSFYIPGNLTYMDIHLEFYSEHPLSMIIGNVTVFNFTGNNTANQTVDVSNAVLSSRLDYAKLSKENVPLRLGAIKQVEGNASIGTVDTALTTSTSGTMGTCDIINNGSETICPDPTFIRRDEAAIGVDKIFADIILNISGNRLSTLSYNNNVRNQGKQTLTNSLLAILSAIDTYHYEGNSKRCYACAIDTARSWLIPNDAYTLSQTNALGALPPEGPGTNYTRARIILLMSDGNPDFCDNTDEAAGSYVQNCGEANAKKQAIDQACLMNSTAPYKVGGSGIKVYTVAFGNSSNIDNSTLIAIANCTGGEFYQSNNYSGLGDIYKKIGQGIATINYTQQVVNISGVAESTLYRNSYIDYRYQKEEPFVGYQEIQVDQETQKFSSCNGAFFIPPQFRVMEARATSYSSDFWTSLVTLNYTNVTVFNLTKFGSYVTAMGDPFAIQIQPSLIITNQTTNITIRLAPDEYGLTDACSSSNRFIFSSGVRASVSYGEVFSTVKGGIVRVYYDIDHDGASDGFTDVVILGPDFDPTIRSVYELEWTDNALDDAFLRLLGTLNFETGGSSGLPGSQTNPIDIKLSDLNLNTTIVGGIPFEWGPLGIRMDVKI